MNTASNSTAKQGFGDAVHLFGKRLLESQQEAAAAYKLASNTGRNGNKKARRFASEEPVKSIIFQLYEDKLYWTTKELRAASGRPETEIKKGENELFICQKFNFRYVAISLLIIIFFALIFLPPSFLFSVTRNFYLPSIRRTKKHLGT